MKKWLLILLLVCSSVLAQGQTVISEVPVTLAAPQVRVRLTGQDRTIKVVSFKVAFVDQSATAAFTWMAQRPGQPPVKVLSVNVTGSAVLTGITITFERDTTFTFVCSEPGTTYYGYEKSN